MYQDKVEILIWEERKRKKMRVINACKIRWRSSLGYEHEHQKELIVIHPRSQKGLFVAEISSYLFFFLRGNTVSLSFEIV